MKNGEFLEKARESRVDHHTFALFANDCWPEILTVVEAAGEASFTSRRSEGVYFAKLGDALEALDKKAGGGIHSRIREDAPLLNHVEAAT